MYKGQQLINNITSKSKMLCQCEKVLRILRQFYRSLFLVRCIPWSHEYQHETAEAWELCLVWPSWCRQHFEDLPTWQTKVKYPSLIWQSFVLFSPQSFWFKMQLRNGYMYYTSKLVREAVSTIWLFAKCSRQVKLKTTENKSQWLPEVTSFFAHLFSKELKEYPNRVSQLTSYRW